MLTNTQNLVQDLQEELVMKDSMTVKELKAESQRLENYYSNFEDSVHELHANVLASCPTQEAETETSELSKIEAELVAELERLELHMDSTLEERKSAFSEVSL